MRRRALLATTGGLLTGGLAGCLAAPGASTESTGGIPEGTWPQVAYDSRNTRHPSDATGPRDGGEIAWRALGDRPVYPPVVENDLYLTEAWTDGAAFSLGTVDGRERWSNSDLPPIRWAPALAEDRVFVLSREPGNVVRLHALGTETGEQAWVRDEGITASSGEHPPISPTVREGSIYIASNRGVVACDAATGDVDWTATLGHHVVDIADGPTWRTDWAKPAVTADRVFTFDTNENYRTTREVHAVARATGEDEWTAELDVGDGWYLTGHVVAGSERVFVSVLKPNVSVDQGDSEWSGAGRLFALDAASGSVEWDWEPSRTTLTTPAYADGTLYVGAWNPTDADQRLHALDATDGSTAWTYPVTESVQTPTIGRDTVYLSHGRELTALATADGTRRWRLELGTPAGPPVVAGDTAYLRTNPGHDDDSQLLAVRAP
ncbi:MULTISPECIES: PQQ-binding-like beta-propeller repeat protein [Haloarcula]|uniref:outer membrane protein assembly factor BamB family protein n=1 Tax=Haloarcula TaxID=2237 RepID=UPI0023ECC220|nr:PQQ-binding-like beta-propeller repeat protein [Halomicroarcula sp. XH51]